LKALKDEEEDMTSNKIARVLAGVAFAACLCFANTASADTSFTLTNVEGASLGGVYTSPYYATVGGTTGVAVICDDFASESYLGETWGTVATNLSSLPTSTTLPSGVKVPLWSSGYSEMLSGSTYTLTAGGLSQATAYTVAAYLGTEILNAAAGSQNQQDLSFAMWTLFDGNTPLTYLSGTDLTGAEGDLLSAENAVKLDGLTPSAYSNVTIYSYDGLGVTCAAGTTCAPPPQEFIAISTPEPSTILLLILGMGGLLFLGRKQRKLEATLAA
jgi:hypothetical protein